MRKIFACLVLAGFAAQAAAAQFINGNTLFERLEGQGADRIWAMAFVIGVNDALTYDARKLKTESCFSTPNGASVQQLSDTVHQWLKRNPGQRHYSAASLVVAALAEAFPCR